MGIKLHSFIKLIVLLSLANFAFANDSLEVPQGEIILEVTGKIAITNEDEYAIFDQAMIDNMEQSVITTDNHVSDTLNTYRGIHFYQLLQQLGATGTHVNITAWDDYVVQIKIEDLKKYDVILATHENNTRLSISDKGPIFVVFPFTEHKEIRRDDYYNMSIWQVRTIEVE